ncbi:hypothetical protein JYK21_07170 [Ralstonia pickettii]|nr:hypothetical protein [Ralstonia pickettii]
MNKIIQFNSFGTIFNKLVNQSKNDLTNVNVEFYHHNFQNEPFLHIEASVENISIEEVDEYGKIISILTSETTLSFSENNYHANLSNDDVVFSSKNDDETYCIISFI